MKYTRYQAKKLIDKQGKEALAAYVEYYANIAETATKAKTLPKSLNQKLQRSVFEDTLSEIGSLMQERSEKFVAITDGPVRKFLDKNPVPACLGSELTDKIRAFCLLLNALRQWAVTEQLAMDRFLVSGNVRKELKELYKICPVAPNDTNRDGVELHHPLRDGRPPIPLSKKGHATIEGLLVLEACEIREKKLVDFKKAKPSSISWRRLRVGCKIVMGESPEGGYTEKYLQSAKNSVSRAMGASGLNVEEILDFLNRYDLGVDQ